MPISILPLNSDTFYIQGILLSEINKKELSEDDIRSMYIDPALTNAGWDNMTQIRRNVTLTPGPIIVRGNLSSRNKKKKKFADYVLYQNGDTPIAVIEAKDNKHTVSSGMQQALGYTEILNVPSAFSSNGDAFASHNDVAAENEDIETEIAMDQFPQPDILWQRYKKHRGIADEHEKLISQPYHKDGSDKEPRYYQVEAISKVMEAIAKNQNRILLVMATGTGKTYTTFQIIWRLWKAKRVKRILFLVDRNILADQTLVNDFKPFGSVMTKIKNRKIDPSYEIYLGLYQAITGTDEQDKIFKNVSRDFFDLIIIDECHRGSAAEDSAWREILEYYENAIQLGMTATPKETKYVSNMTYFGEPVYSYSLKQGVADGFLAPFKVVRIDIDRDVDGWTPPPGMKDDLGKEIEQREYNQKDMDRILILNQRTKLVAKRVMQLLKATNPFSKTIIFCEDIDHAERMRVAIVNAAGKLAKSNPKYCMRITGDSKEGKAELSNFVDSDEKYPVIATTSELLSTGVDAKTCKLIVLDKNINSMTSFKQIIGRGTRIEEEHGKYYFTIMDFKKATELFQDPEFDGDPVVIYEPGPDDDPEPPDPDDDDDKIEEDKPVPGHLKRYVGKVKVSIRRELHRYYSPEGELITESYKDFSKKQVTSEFASLNDFLSKWNHTQKKQTIIDLLEEQGVIIENLQEIVGMGYDAFDLIRHVAYDQPPLTRAERAKHVKKRNYFTKYGEQARAVLSALLDKYADEGITPLENANILKLRPFNEMGTPMEIINTVFGGMTNYEAAIEDLEKAIFSLEQTA